MWLCAAVNSTQTTQRHMLQCLFDDAFSMTGAGEAVIKDKLCNISREPHLMACVRYSATHWAGCAGSLCPYV